MATKKTKKGGPVGAPEEGAQAPAQAPEAPTEPEAPETPEDASQAPPGAPEEPEEAEGAEEAEEGAPPEAVLDATVAMARAASTGDVKRARARASTLDKKVLRDTIAFQLPDEWLTPDVYGILDSMSVEAQSMVLSWLALNWWAGFEAGHAEALKQIADKLKEEGAE